MPLESFEIREEKAIELAKCDNVPKVMIIAGPNGVGKSTLLYALKTRPDVRKTSGELRYIPPHRDWHQTNVTTRSLLGNRRSFFKTISEDAVSGVPDMRIDSSARTPTTSDESAKLIKYSLGQLEMQRKNAIGESFDEGLDTSSFGKRENFFKPLIDLTQTLLPHLKFDRVTLGPDRTDCFWKRAHGSNFSQGESDQVEIDSLSSGEKSIIILFFPFIEFQLEQNLEKIRGKEPIESESDIVVFIDEPELHIHPVLQSRMLNYLRDRSEHGIQFIITTQSPTILDDATSEELFLLTQRKDPEEENRNQLIRLTSDDDKLQALRLLSGNTYSLTSGKNLICVEGELPEDKQAKITDKRILEILCPELAENIILPLGGKFSVIEGARRIRETLPKGIPGMRVISLTDGDRESENDDENSFKLPVCTIENLLLDPDSIMDLLKDYREHSPFKSKEELIAILDKIVSALIDDEKRVRLTERLGSLRLSVSGIDVDSILQNQQENIKKVEQFLPSREELNTIVEQVNQEVEAIISTKNSLRKFRGKLILKQLYDEYIKNLGFPYHIFVINLAKIIAKKPEIIEELCKIFKKINQPLRSKENNTKNKNESGKQK